MAILPVLQHMLLNIGTGHYIHAHVCIHNLSPKLSQKRKTLANSTMLSLHTKGHRILHSRQGPLDRHSPPVPRNSPKNLPDITKYSHNLPNPICAGHGEIYYITRTVGEKLGRSWPVPVAPDPVPRTLFVEFICHPVPETPQQHRRLTSEAPIQLLAQLGEKVTQKLLICMPHYIQGHLTVHDVVLRLHTATEIRQRESQAVLLARAQKRHFLAASASETRQQPMLTYGKTCHTQRDSNWVN